MSVSLSPIGGAGWQFFDNTGSVLTGGKLYTYAAGTTTPQATYTTSAGTVAHTNPIILDAAGRVSSGGEIWLTSGEQYKFILKTATDVLLGTYDNISGINENQFLLISNFSSFAAALAFIGSSEASLIINEEVSISSSVNVPSNVNLVFENGGSFNITGSATVTINGTVSTGAYQIFNAPTITLAVYATNTPASITNNVIFGGVSRPEVCPRWWGAGGSVDDSVALQAALWCVTQASPGITVKLEDSVTYTVSTSMVVDTDYFRLTGGPKSTIKRKNSVAADTMTVLTTGFLGRYTWGPSYPLVGMRFDNFEIDGNKANNIIGTNDNFENNFNALYLSQSRIENLTVYSSLRFGIAISNSSDVIAQGNMIAACDEGGLYAEVGARIIFDSNKVTDTPILPWNIGSLTFNFISQGVISNNVSVGALDGIYLRNTCDSVSIVGNTITGPTRYGIWLFDESTAFTSIPKRITISGNTVSGSGDSCIRMQLASQVAVTGNFLRASATDYCIEFNNGTYQTFSGNVCIGYTTQPIKDAGGNTFTEISNLDGTYTPIVYGSTVAGTGTYTAQTGRWSANGNRVSFTAVITTTAHTGSGSALITLPFYAAGAESTTIPITLYNTTYTGTAVFLINGGQINGTVQIVNPATGGLSNLALPGLATYYINASYQVRDFEY